MKFKKFLSMSLVAAALVCSAFSANAYCSSETNGVSLINGRDQALRGNDSQPLMANGPYYLMFQTDGNLVVYKNTDGLYQGVRAHPAFRVNPATPRVVVSHLGTYGNPGSVLRVQADGNVVLYKGESIEPSTAIWHSHTYYENTVETDFREPCLHIEGSESQNPGALQITGGPTADWKLNHKRLIIAGER
jgi:hypothetical protein